MSLKDTLEDAFMFEELFGPDGPCPTLSEPGDPRLIVITGDNASGKSFLTRIMMELLRKEKVLCVNLSMADRTRSGIVKSMMYGDEDQESTGSLSAHTVEMAFKTARKSDQANAVFLDEPDLGLSDGYATALGSFIRDARSELSETSLGIVIVTHSRALVGELVPFNPWRIRVGDDLRPTATWLAEGDLPRSREDLLSLGERSHQRFLAIKRALDDINADRKASRTP